MFTKVIITCKYSSIENKILTCPRILSTYFYIENYLIYLKVCLHCIIHINTRNTINIESFMFSEKIAFLWWHLKLLIISHNLILTRKQRERNKKIKNYFFKFYS